MSDFVLLVATSNGDGSIFTWSFGSGTLMTAFKGNHSVPHGLCKLGTDYVVAAQTTKQSLHFWALGREQVLQRSTVAEAISVLAASPEGNYLVGGSGSGTLHLWETTSGRLLRTWPAHYKAVTTLIFVGGASLLLSGGEDTMLHTWLLPDLLDPSLDLSADNARPVPLQSWSDHALPVTALLAGAGEAAAVVVSASLDRSIKLRRLSDGRVLRNFALPTAVNDMALDAAEQMLYAAGADGVIYELQLLGADGVDFDAVQRPLLGGGTAAGRSDRGLGAGETADGSDAGWGLRTFTGHSRAVTCLVLASPPVGKAGGGGGGPPEAVLVSGSEDGTVRVWDLNSSVPIQVINVPHGSTISAIQLLPPVRSLLPGGGGGGGAGAGADHAHLAAATGAQAAGLGSAHGGGPRRLQPLAALSKYTGISANIQSWEGPPVIVDGAEAQAAFVSAQPGLFGAVSGKGCGLLAGAGQSYLSAEALGLPPRIINAEALQDAGLGTQRVWELILGARSSEAVS